MKLLVKLLKGGGTSFHISVSPSEFVSILNSGVHNNHKIFELCFGKDAFYIYNFQTKTWRSETE
jgi:hypothetical protein